MSNHHQLVAELAEWIELEDLGLQPKGGLKFHQRLLLLLRLARLHPLSHQVHILIENLEAPQLESFKMILQEDQQPE